MHADLVRPPRLERDPQEGVPRQQLLDLEMRHRVARRIGVERLPERVVAVAPDRSVDRAAQRARPSGDERDVLARERARLHELLQPAVRLGRAGDDEQPRRVAVEPVHDAGPLRLVSTFDVVGEQPVHERPARVPGRRMHDETRRLVDDEQMLVLVRHDEIHLLRLERARRCGRRLELELLPALELVALRARAAVDEHAAAAQQPLGYRARADLGHLRQEAVEPLACRLRRDAQSRH